MILLKLGISFITLFLIFLGIYFLFVKKNKNRNSTIIGYAYISVGLFGFFVTLLFI
ncbi:hypothetical protein VBD025_04535 [Virgibacillus flavescens]|uniref:hypothetical protein n=1 Tax=Virgibacillus flavescens TaxID=1611422 RepID=UPI003D348F3E